MYFRGGLIVCWGWWCLGGGSGMGGGVGGMRWMRGLGGGDDRRLGLKLDWV